MTVGLCLKDEYDDKIVEKMMELNNFPLRKVSY